MHGITKSCALFLWMHTVTFVKSQDCTLDQFVKSDLYSSNLYDISGLETSYAGGKQVRVPCNVGHTGFFRLICTEGEWDHKGAKCQPKSCGHPGEAQFADFRLEKGEDFVFGSKVVYTCHKGYQMVSRINYRNCMSGGWDGVVPVCEALQCPAIYVDNNVHVSGDPEEATYGNVIRFSCRSKSDMLNGSRMIHCDETGQWSSEPPKCHEIRCSTPVIENGVVPGGSKEYKEHEVLTFECKENYKRTLEIPSKCTRAGEGSGWSPTPLCEPIKCTLELPLLGGATYEPATNNVFSPGDKIRVTCGDGYWISAQQGSSTETTCRGDGQWTIRPVCKEITCDDPQDQLVSRWDSRWWQVKKLGLTVSYNCKTNYKRTNGVTQATCTRDGWTPKPLCEEIKCRRKDYPHADIVGKSQLEYKNNDDVDYECKDDYEGRFRITCGENGWRGNDQCTERGCARRVIDNAEITYNNRASYRHNDQVRYRCKSGVQEPFIVTCKKGEWIGVKSCAGCGNAEVSHGFVVGPYNGTLYYACNPGYKRPTKGWWGEATCKRGAWSGLHDCIEATKCGESPVIPNGKGTPTSNYRGVQSLEIACNEGYEAQIDTLPCNKGQWNFARASPKDLCRPSPNRCGPPPRVNNAIVTTPYRKEYTSGSEVTYQCRDKCILEGQRTARCNNGNWEKDIMCTPYCDKLKDERQTMNFIADKDRYMNGDVIEYQCNAPDEVAEGKATCVDGKWNKTAECKVKPCQPPDDTPNGKYDIVSDDGFFVGTTVKYVCNEGYQMVGTDDSRTCTLDGWTNSAPTCKLITCEVGEMHRSLMATGLPPEGEPVKSGNKLRFHCSDEYALDGAKEIECLQNGQWNAPFPTCSDKCTVTGVPANVLFTPLVPDDQVRKGQKLTFTCRLRNHFIHGNSTVECLANGEWSGSFPTCGPAVGCERPPYLADGDIKETVKSEYRHNEKVEYMCQNFYTMEGHPFQTCNNGKWTGQMRCLKPCTVNEDDMRRNNIRLKHRYGSKLYSTHNDYIEFSCAKGRHDGRVEMRSKCVDGVMDLPTCQ